MSSFYNIHRTLLKAFDDSAFGITYYVPNEDYDPPSTGIHAEISFLSSPVESGAKGGDNDFDEVTGIMQISLRDADTGELAKDILDACDLIAGVFKHGVSFSDFEEVHIQNTSISSGRVIGGYFQMDVSISWFSYVDR